MKNHLASIHDRLTSKDPSVLAWWLEKALREAIAANPACATPKLAKILGDALAGKAQGDVTFSVNLPGREIAAAGRTLTGARHDAGKHWRLRWMRDRRS